MAGRAGRCFLIKIRETNVKKNLSQLMPVLVGLGLVLLGGVLGWLTYSDWSALRLSAEELFQRKQGSVLALPGGIEKLNREISALQNSRTQLAKELQDLTQSGSEAWGAGQPWASDPGQWKDRLIEANDQIRKEIGTSGQSGKVVLPPEFYLGFEDYRQKSPSPNEVSDLARQLSVSQRLANHLLASRREVSEPFPTPCVVQGWKVPGVSRSDSGDTRGAEARIAKDLAELQKSQTFLRETYEIKLECSPEILTDLLHRLTRDPWFLLPTQLVVENEQASFPKRAEFEKIFGKPAPGTGAVNPEDPASPSRPPLLLVLSGKEKLRVSLTIDFAGWPPPPPSGSPAAGDGKEGS